MFNRLQNRCRVRGSGTSAPFIHGGAGGSAWFACTTGLRRHEASGHRAGPSLGLESIERQREYQRGDVRPRIAGWLRVIVSPAVVSYDDQNTGCRRPELGRRVELLVRHQDLERRRRSESR